MKNIYRTTICLLLLLDILQQARAQEEKCGILYGEYIEAVAAGNIGYAAERMNTDISSAEISAAKVFSDFSLSASYYNNSDWNMAMGQGVELELSKNITFGVRKARIGLAEKQQELTDALLVDYFRNLRAESAMLYLEAIKQQELYRMQADSYMNIRRLAVSDSLRFEAGEITMTDAIQSRLEAEILYNELINAETGLYRAYAALGVQMGRSAKDTLFCPTEELRPIIRKFSLDSLLSAAYGNRTDLMAALRNEDVAEAALKLVRRERNTDVELSLGTNINSQVRNEIAPAPAFTGISAGIAVPLKFSNINRGEVSAAESRQAQAETYTRQIMLQIETEVIQAYRRYCTLTVQVENYGSRMLDDARSVIDGMLYSYGCGEVSLLEVLSAQRTYNDVRSQYIETLFNHALSLIELEQSAGIWDIHSL